MDVLHHDLETIEAASLRGLDLVGEAFDEVFVNDTIGGGEEGEDVGDEVTFVVIQAVVPVVEVLGEIHLLSGPERSFSLLVHLPDLDAFMHALVRAEV